MKIFVVVDKLDLLNTEPTEATPSIEQCSRIQGIANLAGKTGATFTLRHIVRDCDNFFVFLDLSLKYLRNATFQGSLAFHMSMLERLDNLNVCQINGF